MRYSRALLIGMLALAAGLALSCGKPQGAGEPQRIDIPRASWEPIFFETINALSKKEGWTPLRESRLPADSMEVRLWIGFGTSELQGVRIRRDGTKWSGTHVRNWQAAQPLAPRSGWDALWKRLDALGISTLPDDSTLPNRRLVMDGTSYVVEIRDSAQYRTYKYGNPEYQYFPEAKKIIEIVNVLAEEVGTPPASPK